MTLFMQFAKYRSRPEATTINLGDACSVYTVKTKFNDERHQKSW